jgi:hypothetical protein
MSDQHRMTDISAVTLFMFAGNARFTLVSQKTGKRFTYRMRQSKDEGSKPKVWWVSVLTGSDNETSYSFIGTIFSRLGDFKYSTNKAKLLKYDPRVAAFEWFYFAAQRGQLPEKLEFWHEGRCGKCGRTLTVPNSIESGFGPECILTIHGRGTPQPELPFPH